MTDVWPLLARVGLTRTGGAFDALADPAATDALATALAELMQPFSPDLVVVWDGLSSAVGGYAVGRGLGVRVAMLTDEGGLVTSPTRAGAGRGVVLGAPPPPDPPIARMA